MRHGIYVWMRIIHSIHSTCPRVYTRVCPPCDVLGPRGRTAVPATLSRPRPLHMPLHTHILDRPSSVPLSPISRYFPPTRSLASCRCSIHGRNECRVRRYTPLSRQRAAASATLGPNVPRRSLALLPPARVIPTIYLGSM